ncbi:MAG: PilZ domain-containing protein [Candidatus Omnitrophica bacterium]|nr:PilZ domain-containing protein [Candidatus Omnitrophota bacterium]
MTSGEDKRRFPRIEFRMPVQYHNLKNPREGSIGSLTKNISEGGVKFVANEFLPLASRLVMEISLPTVPRPIKAIAKVAWVRKTAVAEQYEVGNQFLEISRDDKNHLTDYINRVFDSSSN